MKQFFKTRVEWILLIAALLGHLVLLSTRMSQSAETPLLRSWTMEVAAPFLKRAVGSVTSISNLWHRYIDLRRTHEENRALKGQVEQHRRTITAYEEKIKEIGRLQVLAELENSLAFPSVRARVIGGDPTQWYHSRILDKGMEAGLTRDCAAISPDGVVGRIVQVSKRSAVLQLITDVDSGVGVLLENSRAQGVLKGEGRREAFIEYVGSNEKVVVGEKVLTSGLDQIYPKGLLVGYVVATSPAKQVFQKVDVAISADVLKLEEVLVLKKESPS
ncbi:MAG: rod shape-determining protein MreC [Acidobacteria bacterium]|nr:rod shape-determining protein MreC [Acidobacteriota bacterium]MCI0626171.1 rod shape-determining protein MreC [Acidobacteriota bacterium]MCI0718737.1 rod shape-determining protein MreC [Acidobacteriota bacterium]